MTVFNVGICYIAKGAGTVFVGQVMAERGELRIRWDRGGWAT